MTEASAAKLKQRAAIEELIGDSARVHGRVKEKVAEPDARFADIAANPFYKIAFADTAPEAKRAEFAQALTFAGTKAENRARVQEFETFKEYLSSVREEMAVDIIRLTDTDTMAELQRCLQGFNEDLLDYEGKMKPLTEIIEAVHRLRADGQTLNAFIEIAEAKKQEKAREEARATIAHEMDEETNRAAALLRRNADLGQQRSMWGWGGVTEEARQEIARNELEMKNAETKLNELGASVQKLNDEAAQADSGEYAEQKKKLRELLDISTDEHSKRQQAVVDSALNFVQKTKDRVGTIRVHLGKMNNQMDNLFDANSNMTTLFAVMNEGIKEAGAANQSLRDKVLPPEGDENPLAKVQRDQKKQDLEHYIGVLDESARDTLETFADLTSQQIRIKTMRDATDDQSNKARTLHTKGIAGVADRLSVVLQAVSSAALNESQATARDTLGRMHDSTNLVAQKEAIRVASGIQQVNEDMLKAIEDLDTYGVVMKKATDIQRTGLEEMRANMDQLKQLAGDTMDVVHDSIAVAAEVGSGKAKKAPGAKGQPPERPVNPFNIGAH